MTKPKSKPPLHELKPHAFFAGHPIFRHDEFAAAYEKAGHSKIAVTGALAYYVRTGVIINVRRGVYAVRDAPFHPWLLPSKLNPLAVVAYDGAASFHRLAGLGHSVCFLTPRALPPFSFSEIIYRGIAAPQLHDVSERIKEIQTYRRDRQDMDVTTPERTIVDCFDRSDLAPDLEEIFRTVLSKPELPLDLDRMVRYAIDRASGIAAARLGLLLSAHPQYRYAREHLAELARRVPPRTNFATRDREPGGLHFTRWRLIAPRALAEHLSNE